MDKEMKKEILELVEMMDEVIEDRSVPRNIRTAIDDAKNKISDLEDATGLKFSEAIYLLDDVSNDINMPAHTRTEIWNIISGLESVKEKLK